MTSKKLLLVVIVGLLTSSHALGMKKLFRKFDSMNLGKKKYSACYFNFNKNKSNGSSSNGGKKSRCFPLKKGYISVAIGGALSIYASRVCADRKQQAFEMGKQRGIDDTKINLDELGEDELLRAQYALDVACLIIKGSYSSQEINSQRNIDYLCSYVIKDRPKNAAAILNAVVKRIKSYRGKDDPVHPYLVKRLMEYSPVSIKRIVDAMIMNMKKTKSCDHVNGLCVCSILSDLKQQRNKGRRWEKTYYFSHEEIDKLVNSSLTQLGRAQSAFTYQSKSIDDESTKEKRNEDIVRHIDLWVCLHD